MLRQCFCTRPVGMRPVLHSHGAAAAGENSRQRFYAALRDRAAVFRFGWGERGT